MPRDSAWKGRCPMRPLAITPPRPLILTALLSLATIPTIAAAQSTYTPNGSFTLPNGTWGIAPDGLIWAITPNATILRQTALNASTYTPVGSLPAGTIPTYGASFLSISPDGTRLAIGDNNFGPAARIYFVSTTDLGPTPSPTTSVLSPNYAGAWLGSQFYVSGAGIDFVPFVSRISFTNNTTDPVPTRILTGIGGASGGVALINTPTGPRLYTGVGFEGNGLPAGDIRGFDLLSLVTSHSPTNYATGTPIPGGPALSASTLTFDANGTLLVGGFDGGAALAINIVTGDRTALSPAGTTGGYHVAFNTLTNEALITHNGIAYRYTIPTPATAMILGAFGLLATPRRR